MELIPNMWILSKSDLWRTVSNAFEKSSDSITTIFPVLSDSVTSFKMAIEAAVADPVGLKAYWSEKSKSRCVSFIAGYKF